VSPYRASEHYFYPQQPFHNARLLAAQSLPKMTVKDELLEARAMGFSRHHSSFKASLSRS
jgi:hypothetical protein